MAGLQTTSRVKPFGIYIGYMILYILTLRMMAIACAWACSSKHMAAAWTGFLFTILSVSAGYSVHLKDLSIVFSWAQWISPVHWVYQQLAQNEFNSTLGDDYRYACSHNPVVQQENTILMRAECGLGTDLDALKFHSMQEQYPLYQPISIVVVFHAVCVILGLFLFMTFGNSKKTDSERG